MFPAPLHYCQPAVPAGLHPPTPFCQPLLPVDFLQTLHLLHAATSLSQSLEYYLILLCTSLHSYSVAEIFFLGKAPVYFTLTKIQIVGGGGLPL